MRFQLSFATLLLAGAALLGQAAGQTAPPTAPAAAKPPTEVAGFPVNYDEAKAGGYTLPDPLKMANGQPVKTAKEWMQKRRPELVKIFEEQQFGKMPGRPKAMSFEVFDKGTPAMDGKAIRQQVTVYFSADHNGPREDIVIYTPAQATKPVPLLLTINFSPNAAIFDDPGIKLGEMWGRDHKKVPAQRGRGLGRMKIDGLLEKGIGVAGIYYGQIDPDFLGGLPYGVRALYLKPGQKAFAPDEWGTISAWAWGLSRAMDYLETDKKIDAKRVALYGVSRLGKTVLWAGAHDPRFALVVSSCSGEGGAALSRRNFGETIAHMTAESRFGYQFCANRAKYAEHPEQCPVDAHELVALMAPRPVFLQTGDQDLWSDPKGEFLSAVAAEPVYRLLGKEGLGLTNDQMPKAGEGIFHDIGYHMHAGGHGTMPGDWAPITEYLVKYLHP